MQSPLGRGDLLAGCYVWVNVLCYKCMHAHMATFLQERLRAHVQITLRCCTAGHQSTGIIALITILQ